MFRVRRFSVPLILLVVTVLVLDSCRSQYQRALKTPDPRVKLELAELYYKKKDFFRAITLLEQIEDAFHGTAAAEKVLYYSAQSNFGLHNYMLAGFQFKSYFESYPTGEWAEEALYMTAYSSFLESQDSELDQTDTYKAIETMKIFINVYPDSKYIPECNTMLDKLRYKLSYKAYRTAKLYFDIGEYKSAIVALQNVIKDFPETPQKEEIDFLTLKSYYLLALNSVPEKQKDRYEQTLSNFTEFAETYREGSKYMDEARTIKANTEIALKKMNIK